MERRSTDSDLRSDADLIASARDGDAGAFGVLYERHAGAALVVARQYTSGHSEAEDVVADAFAAVWSALRSGTGPHDAFRAYLFTVVRRSAAVQRTRGRRAEPTDDLGILEAGSLAEPGAEEPALAGFERSVVARAFASLPERWQAVLWHSEIEGLNPAQIAPLLGLSANSTAALAYRAREGLRQAYLQEHLAEPLDESHRAVAAKLGGYVRGGLGARDTAQVEGHLEGCGDCRALALELRDVNRGLRGVIAPLVLGALGLGALRYTLPTSGGTAAGAASLAAGAGGGAGAGGAASTAGGGAATGTTTAAGTGATAATGATGATTAATGATATVGAAATGAAGAGVAGLAVAGSAAAVGTAGAAASGGLIAALVGVFGGVPAAIAAGVAGLVVVTGATIGITQLVVDDPPPAEAGATASPTTTSDPTALPTTPDEPTLAADEPVATPTDTATTDPATEPADEATEGAGSGIGAATVTDTSGGTQTTPPANEPTTPSAIEPSQPPVIEPTEAPTTDPPTAEPTPTTEPTPTPTPTDDPTTPPAEPAHLVLADSTTSLDADGGDQELAVSISNSGGTAATGLTASVDLPASFTVTGVVGDAGGSAGLPAAAAGWSCDIVVGGVRCTLPVLDAGASTRLAVLVDVDEEYPDPDGQVVWHVAGAGLDATSMATGVAVTPAPARLTVPATTATLARGRTLPLTLAVRNAGGVPADAAVTITVPPGITVTGTEDDWRCRPSSSPSVLRCTQPELAPRTTSPLVLAVRAAAGASDGVLALTLAPAGRFAPTAQVEVPYTLSAPVLSLGLSASADGAVTATVRTDVAEAADVRLTVAMPDGLELDPKDDAWPAACTASGPTATCELGTVAYGEAATIRLPARVAAAIADEVTARATATGAAPVTATAPVGTSSSGMSVRFQSKGEQRLDAVQIGAPVLGCPGCGTGTHDNNGLPLQRLGATSSTLTLPAGATVRFAGLYWSGNRYVGEDWTSSPSVATLRGPLGEATTVEDVDGPVTVTDNSHRTYYQSFADVTDLVARLGRGTWTVGDVAVSSGIPDGGLDPVPTYYGGWALVVVVDDPDATPGVLTVYDGGTWVGSGAAQEFRFTTTPGADVRVGVVAWEGDQSTTGDQLLLDGLALTPRRSSGSGSPSNAFDATAMGWSEPNSLGVDAKSFLPRTTKGTVGVLRASSTGDQYLLGAVTVRVEQGDS